MFRRFIISILILISCIAYIIETRGFNETREGSDDVETLIFRTQRCIRKGTCSSSSACCSNICKKNRRCRIWPRKSAASATTNQACRAGHQACSNNDDCCTKVCDSGKRCSGYPLGHQLDTCPSSGACIQDNASATTEDTDQCIDMICSTGFCNKNTRRCSCPVDILDCNKDEDGQK